MEEDKSRCDGETHEGHRCTKTGKILVQKGEHWLCWTHWMSWSGGRKCDRPWEILDMSIAPDEEKLGKLTVKKIATMLRDGPLPAPPCGAGKGQKNKHVSEEDTEDVSSEKADSRRFAAACGGEYLDRGAFSEGFIYVYRLETDRNDEMYKIGFTAQKTVEDRLKDWPGSILVCSWKTHCPHFAETLIHLFLQHWRCYRFVFRDWDARKRFVSTWFDDCKTYVPDQVYSSRRRPLWLDATLWAYIRKDEVCPQFNAKSRREHRFDMEKEWFYVEWNYAKPIIEGVVECVERHYKDWHKNFQVQSAPQAQTALEEVH